MSPSPLTPSRPIRFPISNQKARVNAILGQIQGLYDELRQIAVETGETVYVNSPSGERSEYVYINDEPTATE